jgi:hypothetical protein
MERAKALFDTLEAGMSSVGEATTLEDCGNWSCASSIGLIGSIICISVSLSLVGVCSDLSYTFCKGKKVSSRGF